VVECDNTRLLEGAAVELGRCPEAQGGPLGPRAFALDIALDEVLVRRGSPVVRVWRPLQRVVVLGVASRAADELLLEQCRADNLPVLRRSTGGGAVLVTPDVACFSCIMPHERHPKAKQISGAYALAFEGLARAFGTLGLDVDFERPGDVALSGRKIVGLAQARRRRATLVHGVIPVGIDPELFERYIAHPESEPPYRSGRRHRDFVTTLARETGSSGEVLMRRTLSALAQGLSGAEPSAAEPDGLAELLAEARKLVDERYGRDDWTYRL
jgi:lipoate-protein ligase A